ncbi:MAG TPA: glycosyl hydrolase [Solirubrobacteraceae bacterium]|nr:glycosyl hydrolase [Solirubrobacteraceae bacterium]
MTSATNILHAGAIRVATATCLAWLVLSVLAGAATAQPLFGIWSPGEPYAGSVAGADALERATGRRVSIVHWYQNWGGSAWASSVQPHAVRAVTDSGRLPLLTWEPQDPQQGPEQPAYRLASIAAGAHDAYIASFARGLRDLGTPVYLRPMHEMNGNWYPWAGGVNANTTGDFVQAWQRMHRIFAAEGAGNVRWVWSPNNFDASPAYPMEAFYPGASFVDVLAADGYNWGSTRPQFGGWQTFAQVFQVVYDRLKALGPQPIWMAEVGTAPNGGDKPAWIRDMFTRAQGMDRLQALVWFNEFKELDWRADADSGTAAAFAPVAPGSVDSLPHDASAPPAPTPPDPHDASNSLSIVLASAAATAGAPPAGSSLSDHQLAALGLRGSDTGAVDTGSTGSGAGSPGTAQILLMHTDERVPRGRRSVVRWRAVRPTVVRRWVIYLDGLRVHSVTSGGATTHRLARRSTRIGTHRWDIVGHDAAGRHVVSGARSFRVVRAR